MQLVTGVIKTSPVATCIPCKKYQSIHCMSYKADWPLLMSWIARQIKQLACRKQRAFKHAHLTDNPHARSKDFLYKSVALLLTDTYQVLLMKITMLQKKLWSFIKNKKQDCTGLSESIQPKY